MKSEVLVLQGRASKAGDDAPRITVELPESIQEAYDVWGEEKTEALFAAAVRDNVLRVAKTRFAGGMSTEDLQGVIGVGWVPGTRGRPKEKAPAKLSSALKLLSKCSDEEFPVLVSKLIEADPRFAEALSQR